MIEIFFVLNICYVHLKISNGPIKQGWGCSNIRKGNKNVFHNSNDEDEMLFSLRKFRVRSRYSETSNTDVKRRRKTCAEGPNACEEENASLVPKKKKAENLKRNCKSMKLDETKETS